MSFMILDHPLERLPLVTSLTFGAFLDFRLGLLSLWCGREGNFFSCLVSLESPARWGRGAAFPTHGLRNTDLPLWLFLLDWVMVWWLVSRAGRPCLSFVPIPLRKNITLFHPSLFPLVAQSSSQGKQWNTTCWYWHLFSHFCPRGDSLTVLASRPGLGKTRARSILAMAGAGPDGWQVAPKWWQREAENKGWRGWAGGEEARPGPTVWFRREKKWGRASPLDYLFCFVFFFLFCSFLSGPFLWAQRALWYSQACRIFWVSECFCLMNHSMLPTNRAFWKNGFGVRSTIRNCHQQWPSGVYDFGLPLPLFTGGRVPCTAKWYLLIL